MTEFFEFCREYGVYFLTLLCFIIEIIFLVVKRRPKSIDDFKLAFEEALALVPELVISRERPGEGELKKKEVITSCSYLVSRLLGRKLSDYETVIIRDAVSDKIETVLSTPIKKEISNEK